MCEKSFNSDNARVKYCVDNSLKQSPAETKLTHLSLKERWGIIMGDPPALQLLKDILRSKNGSRVLDVGTFTGMSALAWAVTVPDDGQVYTFDVDHTPFERAGKICAEEAGVLHKITPVLGQATHGLNELLMKGEAGKFDLMFIDADKTNYDVYYELGIKLIKSGGCIAIDNAVWSDRVLLPDADQDADTRVIDQLNRKIHADDRVHATLLPIADGLHIVFKK